MCSLYLPIQELLALKLCIWGLWEERDFLKTDTSPKGERVASSRTQPCVDAKSSQCLCQCSFSSVL